jgi:hypothetical protein
VGLFFAHDHPSAVSRPPARWTRYGGSSMLNLRAARFVVVVFGEFMPTTAETLWWAFFMRKAGSILLAASRYLSAS